MRVTAVSAPAEGQRNPAGGRWLVSRIYPGRAGENLCGRQGAVVIAMAAMRVMEMSVDEIVDVISVRNRFMAATGTMLMPGLVTGAEVIRRTSRRIGVTHLDHVLIDVIAVRLMQVAVVQVVDVIAVLDGDMAAAGAVNVGMTLMNSMFVRHRMIAP